MRKILITGIILTVIGMSGCFANKTEDIVKPEIKLIGKTSIYAIIGKKFLDPGVTAIDNVDGEITDKISRIIYKGDVLVSEIDTTTKGVFTIKYNITDKAGNKADEVIRQVEVREPFISTYETMYVRGTFNTWGTTKMILIDDYQWEIQNIKTDSTFPKFQRFKFDVTGNWSINYGDTNKDGIADLEGADIYIEASSVYNFTFNDKSRKYTMIKLK